MLPIYLTGTRASGKTTVGNMLAGLMGCAFIDLDASLCESTGKSVAEIVASHGWAGFRAIESKCLQDATAEVMEKKGGIISTGGGIVLAKENREHMRTNGTVIWLKASPATMRARLLLNPLNSQRPSLTGKGILEEMEDILKEREPLYRMCAHHELDANGDADGICRMIISILSNK